MSDSVDRVFVHALNTVKRIPRTGSARPPPASRLKLYGLYKQSTEGDVEGVMKRPRGHDEDIKTDQEKWDTWSDQHGLSKTEAKRRYMQATPRILQPQPFSLFVLKLIPHASDARELVSELEFVWDQIKSNPPSSSSSNSHPNHEGSRPSPDSNGNQLIYPVMSEHGARNPGAGDSKPMQEVDPISQHSSDEADVQGDAGDAGEGEEFVDAPDSQIDEQAETSPGEAPQAQPRGRNFGRDASAMLAPFARYLTLGGGQNKQPADASLQWQRRIESALIKMNTELAALREQLDMQQDANMHSSLFRPFKFTRRGGGFAGWLFRTIWSVVLTVAKHVVIDATLVILVAFWMRYKGIPAERLEHTVVRWVQQIRSIAYVRKIERQVMRKECVLPVSFAKSMPFQQSLGLRPNG